MCVFPLQDKMRGPVVLMYLLLLLSPNTALTPKPRRSISYQDVSLKQFKVPSFTNMSSMLISEDLGQLVVGARGKMFSLNLGDISDKTSEIEWIVSSRNKALCEMKGKDAEDCDNYVKALHTTQDGKFLVCGTNAFDPVCDHMTLENGTLILEGNHQGGRGSVPFDPHQMQTSLMVDDTLYSASFSNFLGTQPVFQKSGPNPLKNEMLQSWFYEPSFVSIKLVETSKSSEDGDDDNVFLFFTEKAAEERLGNTRVSRIARVCKGDMGGQRTLQRKWTTYLKARLDCPLAQPGMPSLVQDVFLLENPDDWRDSIFYGTFSSEPETSGTWGQSAVCAYKLSYVTEAFRGRFLTRLHSGRWDTYTGEVPVPRPGSCIDNEIRATGVTSSLDLPDQSLLFVKEHPLMESAVRPLSGKPLLVQAGTRFSKITVERVPSLDGEERHVMFIGTDSGWLQKAVWFSGEGSHIIEELQLFQTPQPVSFLQLSSTTGQLYTGSRDVVVQTDTSDCSSYTTCYDCVLARDPYCGWDQVTPQCAPAAGASSWSMIQSLNDGDVSMCPSSEVKTKPIVIHLDTGTSQLIPCSPEVNLPVSWKFPDTVVLPSDRHMVVNNDLLITGATKSDAGLYNCKTVETVKGNNHYQTVVQYLLLVQDTKSAVTHLEAAVITLAVLLGLILMKALITSVVQLVNKALYITVGCVNIIANSDSVIIRCVAPTDEDHWDTQENDHHNDYDHHDNYLVIEIPEEEVDHQGYNNYDNYEVIENPEEELDHQGSNNNHDNFKVMENPEEELDHQGSNNNHDNFKVMENPEEELDHQGCNNNHDNYKVMENPEEELDHQGCNNNHDNYKVMENPEEELDHQGCNNNHDNYEVMEIPEEELEYQGYDNNHDNYEVMEIPEEELEYQGFDNIHDNYDVIEIPEHLLEHQGCGDH